MNSLLCHWFGSSLEKYNTMPFFLQQFVTEGFVNLLFIYQLHLLCIAFVTFAFTSRRKKRLFKIHSAKFNFNALSSTNASQDFKAISIINQDLQQKELFFQVCSIVQFGQITLGLKFFSTTNSHIHSKIFEKGKKKLVAFSKVLGMYK